MNDDKKNRITAAKDDRPSMRCPECGASLIPAHGRGRVGDEWGELVEHDDSCRCRWCQWLWFDDRDPTTCACGAIVKVFIYGGSAYARKVNDE